MNSGNALIQQVKNAIFVFPILPGSAEKHVTWGRIVKHLLIAYFIRNISATKCQNLFMCQSSSKPNVGRLPEVNLAMHVL